MIHPFAGYQYIQLIQVIQLMRAIQLMQETEVMQIGDNLRKTLDNFETIKRQIRDNLETSLRHVGHSSGDNLEIT